VNTMPRFAIGCISYGRVIEADRRGTVGYASWGALGALYGLFDIITIMRHRR